MSLCVWTTIWMPSRRDHPLYDDRLFTPPLSGVHDNYKHICFPMRLRNKQNPPLTFCESLLPFQCGRFFLTVMSCWLGGRQTSPNWCGLYLILGAISFANSTFSCGRTDLQLQRAAYSTSFEDTPDFEMSILEPLPGLCCYCLGPLASSFSWEGLGMCLKESVH